LFSSIGAVRGGKFVSPLLGSLNFNDVVDMPSIQAEETIRNSLSYLLGKHGGNQLGQENGG